MSPIYFVHIPKTAGTSFRKASETFFGLRHVVYDYADDSNETSPFILDIVYGDGDRFEFVKYLETNEIKFLSGHVHADKYLHIFGAANTVVFLRDPVQRTISEYQHLVRHNKYEGDLRSFYTQPRYINRQSRLLHGAPLEALGFVGLTEDYHNSLDQINHCFSVNVQPVELNRGRTKKQDAYKLSDEVVKEIEELNEVDLRLYKTAQNILKNRTDLFQKELPYVHSEIQDANKKLVRGWAWYATSEQPVDIQVLVNGQVNGHMLAKDLRPGLLRLSPPRKGYVGFHHKFSEQLATGDVVECVVEGTGQSLGKRTV